MACIPSWFVEFLIVSQSSFFVSYDVSIMVSKGVSCSALALAPGKEFLLRLGSLVSEIIHCPFNFILCMEWITLCLS